MSDPLVNAFLEEETRRIDTLITTGEKIQTPIADAIANFLSDSEDCSDFDDSQGAFD